VALNWFFSILLESQPPEGSLDRSEIGTPLKTTAFTHNYKNPD
jgi:hypothetical protein